jgi:hypothetical protein
MSNQPFFVAGGTLDGNTPSYVVRPADQELLQKILASTFCYVLTARQTGKSSLMIRTVGSLRKHNVKPVVIDLTTIGGFVAANEWYLGILSQIKSALKLQADVVAFWREYDYLSTQQRFINFLYDVVLHEISDSVAIFIDEIDTTLKLDFRDDFFTTIRAVYNARATDPLYNRLTFILLGVATPSDLIQDTRRTPFNIGHRIELHEFRYPEMAPLRQGLEQTYPGQADRLLKRIFHWTSGHPYLTQRLCKAAIDSDKGVRDDTDVDQLVNDLFIAPTGIRDSNLDSVYKRIQATESDERQELLAIYRDIYHSKPITADDSSPIHNHLQLAGLVRIERGIFKVRNEIYRRVFNDQWIKEYLPTSNQLSLRWIVIAAVIFLVLAFGGYAAFAGFPGAPSNTPTPIASIDTATIPVVVSPSVEPATTSTPTTEPTSTPTTEPTSTPTTEPTSTPTTEPTSTPTTEPTSTPIVCNVATAVSMRSGPSTTAPRIKDLDVGSEVIKLADSTDGFWVQVRDLSDGTEGWVSVGYLNSPCQ